MQVALRRVSITRDELAKADKENRQAVPVSDGITGYKEVTDNYFDPVNEMLAKDFLCWRGDRIENVKGT